MNLKQNKNIFKIPGAAGAARNLLTHTSPQDMSAMASPAGCQKDENRQIRWVPAFGRLRASARASQVHRDAQSRMKMKIR